MKVVFAGDFCPNYRVADILDNGKSVEVASGIKDKVLGADYSVLNFECPVADDHCVPISKQGPNLRCTENAVSFIKENGFKCVTLANNHFLDFGEGGVRNTLCSLSSRSIEYLGGGMNLEEASRILYKKISDIKVAFINCCEHEFSIASVDSAGSNPLDVISICSDIRRAKSLSDYVVVIVHGGHEFYQLPSPRMKKLYHFFVDIGADVIVNHHQHCYSGYEIYNDAPIFYGLGNFCFDWQGKTKYTWNYGYMVELTFADKLLFNIIPYCQCGNAPEIRELKEFEIKEFDANIASLNEIVQNDEALYNYYRNYLKSSEARSFLFSMEPYSGKCFKYLYLKGFLPSFITKQRKANLLNYIRCESHLDRMLYYLSR